MTSPKALVSKRILSVSPPAIVPSMRGLHTNGKMRNNLVYGCDIGISVFSTAGWEFSENTIVDGTNNKVGAIWWYDNKEDMTALTWVRNTISGCDQLMLFKFDCDLLQEHDFNCYGNGTFDCLTPWQTQDFNDFRATTEQEKHSVGTDSIVGIYEYTNNQ